MPDGAISIPLVWTGQDGRPFVLINQLLSVVNAGEIYLQFGTVTPPAIFAGTAEAMEDQLRKIGYLQVETHFKMTMSRPRIDEFVTILTQTAAKWDAEQQARKGLS